MIQSKDQKLDPKRKDISPVWYLYTMFTKEGQTMGRCKCGNHECKIIDGSTSNLLRHLCASHSEEFDAKLHSLEAQGKKTNRLTSYYCKVGAWKPDSPNVV